MTALLRFSGAAAPLSETGAMPGWRPVHVGFEGDDFKIAGIDVWKSEWRTVQKASIRLWHPSYPSQLHDYSICEVGDPSAPVRFAVAELSNGVYGFFVQETEQQTD
jgi:hypothetical protein